MYDWLNVTKIEHLTKNITEMEHFIEETITGTYNSLWGTFFSWHCDALLEHLLAVWNLTNVVNTESGFVQHV